MESVSVLTKAFHSLLLTGNYYDPGTNERLCIIFLATDQIDEDCLAAIKEQRGRTPEAAIVVLHSGTELEQEILAFEAGADDCIPLSFDFRYLSGRLRATAARLRRGTNRKAWITSAGASGSAVDVDPLTHQVIVGERRLRLSPLQFRLLVELQRERGKVVPHEHLEKLLWGEAGTCSRQSMKQLISRLRRQLGTHAQAIVSLPGVGYMLR